jgi:hypothetical protein
MPAVSSAPRSASSEPAASANVLGIGFSYITTLPADLYRPGLLDFVEITPELLCRARRDGEVLSMDLVPDKLERARATCGELPIVVHGVELSIGSALHWNTSYLDMLDRFQAIWRFHWHSEHLTYQTHSRRRSEAAEHWRPVAVAWNRRSRASRGGTGRFNSPTLWCALFARKPGAFPDEAPLRATNR